MKILVLTRYARLGASSRLRFLQYLPYLDAQGLHTEVSSLFSDVYVKGLQVQRRDLKEIIRAYVGRLVTLLRSSNYDLIWIEKDLLPWLPACLELALITGRRPWVIDYDDAVFHHYDLNRRLWVRTLLGGKHPKLMRGAATVVVGNSYLAEFASRSGARRVEILPTVVDLERYPVGNLWAVDDGAELPSIGWIGQRASAALLSPLRQLFEDLHAERLCKFVAVGIDAQALNLPMESVPWSEATEVATIAKFKVGLMPLVDEPFERGKCGYKLIQYMACGLPVIASPVGVNSQIVEHGVNGFLASTPSEWESALRALLGDPEMRARMGRAGRRKVEQQYCAQITGPRMATLLKSLGDSFKNRSKS